MKKKILIICGPTASGKTYLGHYLAKLYNGEIINSDSMQIYQQIPIITASPTSIYCHEINYHLYNFLSIDQEFSVIKYLQQALEKIQQVIHQDKLPIIIGGTGLYINSLLFGYNAMPKISSRIRQYVRKLHTNIGQLEFFNKLQKLDIIASQKLHPADTQRSIRAYEVYLETGQSIFNFHVSQNTSSLSNYDPQAIFLHPERKFLYQTCNDRLEQLFYKGSVEEIALVTKNFPHIATSGTKAIGFQEILAYLTSQITLPEALALAQTRTRQYAKRQITWFKHQIKEKTTLEYSTIKQFEEIVNKLSKPNNLLSL